jgi:3-phytase
MVVILILLAALTAAACSQPAEPPTPATQESPAPTPPAFDDKDVRLDPRLVADLKRVPEVFRTVPLTEGKDVDSLAFWRGPEGPPWLLVTQKDLSYILVLDATTGELLKKVEGPGDELGQFNRPNGIAVIDDLVLVVEKNARRIQVLRLPDFEPLGTFGEELLQWPYGVAVDHPGEWYEVFVTDSYDSPEHEPPAPEVAANRLRHYRFRPTKAGLDVELVRSFGEPTGDGALYRVESLAIDRPMGRLYVADESRQRLNLKAYSLDGAFLGTFGDGRHYREPEGVLLLGCGPEEAREGYIIAADQTQPSRFLVWDRRSLVPRGGFTGEPTIDITDGIAFAAMDDGPGAGGMFYATHWDVQVVAYRWIDIVEALGLRTDCR